MTIIEAAKEKYFLTSKKVIWGEAASACQRKGGVPAIVNKKHSLRKAKRIIREAGLRKVHVGLLPKDGSGPARLILDKRGRLSKVKSHRHLDPNRRLHVLCHRRSQRTIVYMPKPPHQH